MIKLIDFIEVPNMERTKIKFNMNPSDPKIKALDLLLDNELEWIEMNSWKTKQPNNNLNNADYLIAMAQYYPYGPEYFIFGGLYKVEKIIPEVFDEIGYKLTLKEAYSDYIKRLIIKIEKPIGRDLYNRLYSTIHESLKPEIYELSPRTKLGHFIGYQNVSLMHKELQLIVKNDEPSWRNALSNVKCVYAITDTSSGKLYIGSASGNSEGIWQRWCSYANLKDLAGGNDEFKELIKKYGKEHIINNFQYSILEIFDTKTKIETILMRESYWKNVFCTRTFGMNKN